MSESKIISNIKLKIDDFLYFCGFLKLTLKELFSFWLKKDVTLKVLIRQILFTGYEALAIITLIGLAIGAIIIIYGFSLLSNFGQTDLVYTILIIIVTKELGPIITAFILIARSGTAISTELGNMVVNHEVEALNSIGVNPISYLVVPRILGVIISFFGLLIYLNIAGILGGYIFATIITPIPFIDFISNFFQKLKFLDIIVSILKSIIFGFIISLIPCYYGLKVEYATTEVPQKTIKAVVSSLTWVIILDIGLAIITYSFM